jgi:hypothetical protein
MRIGRKRNHGKASGKPLVRGSAKATTGAREFNRRMRTKQRRIVRGQRLRDHAKSREADGLSLIERSHQALARIPTAARVCALLAFMNAVCWSLITPPFEVPDEPAHFAYVQQLAEYGSLPRSASENFSPEVLKAERALHAYEVRFDPAVRTIASRTEQQTLEEDLSQPLSRMGAGKAGVATAEPPLYYVLQLIPYGLGLSGTILNRLALMRLMSALMAAFTALFVFLFLREALSGVRWAWTVGGLGAAVAPLLGFISGAVNPDAMLSAVSAALFYCLARAFRRGLTRWRAMLIGVVIAVGFMTKLNFAGLAPGALLGLILLARREARTSGREVYYRSLAPALLIALSPGILYALVNIASGHPTLGIVSSGIGGLINGGKSISQELSYMWQLYLPRLPWMHDYFGEIFTTRQLWFNGLVGLYGWLDTVFPAWVYDVAVVPVGLIGIFCIRELVVGHVELWRRRAELITYVAMSVGLLTLIALSGYRASASNPAEFAEPRYMLPMLALWAAVLALAARGAGRRWGPAAGILIVLLVLAHDIFSQLQVIARFYG